MTSPLHIALVVLTVMGAVVMVRSFLRCESAGDRIVLTASVGFGALLVLVLTNLARMMLAADGVLAAVPQIFQ